jgi:hypothetical protein
VAKYGAESWTINKDITKRQNIVGKKRSFKKMCGVIKVNKNWRKKYDKS